MTTFRVTVVDGVETARETLSTTVTRAPVAEQVTVGTKAEARPTGAARADGAQLGPRWRSASRAATRGAVNTGNGYYGLYQFSLEHLAVRRRLRPARSRPRRSEQTARAQMLYNEGRRRPVAALRQRTS